MKVGQPVAAVLVTLAVAVCAVGCSGPRRISPAKFVDKAATLSTSIHDVNFVGVYEGRAYLSEWTMWPVMGSKTRLLWTEASRLTPEYLRELKARKAEEDREAAESRRRHHKGGSGPSVRPTTASARPLRG